jgi:hypothetical protein
MNIRTLRIFLIFGNLWISATFGFPQPLDCGNHLIVATAKLWQPLDFGHQEI